MDLPSIYALQAYWRAHPPVHQLVASYMGYKVPDKKAVGQNDGDLQAAAEFGIPVATISAAEYDQQLQDLGIPL